MSSPESLGHNPNYAARIAEISDGRDCINFAYGGTKIPVPLRPGEEVPLGVTIDDTSYATLATISVGEHPGQQVDPMYGKKGIENAIQGAKVTYAVVQAASGERGIMTVSPEELAKGSVQAATSEGVEGSRIFTPLGKESTRVPVESTPASSTDLVVSYNDRNGTLYTQLDGNYFSSYTLVARG